MAKQLEEGNRVINGRGNAGTLKAIEAETAYVLFDYQARIDQPVAVPLSELTFISDR